MSKEWHTRKKSRTWLEVSIDLFSESPGHDKGIIQDEAGEGGED